MTASAGLGLKPEHFERALAALGIVRGLGGTVAGSDRSHDQGRTGAKFAWLEAQGYRVIRFRNEELMGDLDAVLERIHLNL